ncbi:MAG: hypothetical protein ABSG91_20060 [Syntrophobacteraceae bacterium]
MTRTSELNILKKIAADIAKSIGDMPSGLLTGFMAMVGHSYSNELMVIGRAVNGWGTGWEPRTWNDELVRDRFANDVFKSVTDGDACPMQWVSRCWGNYDYECNTRKSQFWRVIRNTVSELKIADVENTVWPSHLVWSNLYKIAPFDGGNPSNQLCSLQFEGCKALLHEEFRLYRPKRALFLTGIDWAGPFLAEFTPPIHALLDYQYVEAAGQIIIENVQRCKAQGKIEDVWVSEVSSVFED